MRPESIVTFEQLMLGTLGLGLIQLWLHWDEGMAKARGAPHAATFVVIILAITLAIMLLLILLISRRRSKIAMWISIVLFALSVPTFAKNITEDGSLASLTIVFLQLIGQVLAYGLLFTPTAREWMNEGH